MEGNGELRTRNALPSSGSPLGRYRGVASVPGNIRFARHPSRVHAKGGDQFSRSDLSGVRAELARTSQTESQPNVAR
jgi:hypothetical protein